MSNILKPELVWIEGRCYRNTDTSTEVNTFQEHDLYENETVFKDSDENDEYDNIEVVALDNSRFSTSFHVSKHYLGAIIGKKGYTKSRIEHETKTEIKIPRQGKEGDITILGPSATNVKAARRRIDMIVLSSRMKQRPTHFISIPMNKPDIVNNFIRFQESVLRECRSRGIEESIFIRANKVHLTLGVLCLMDNEERSFASKILTEAKERVILPILQGHLPVKIRIKGLSYMNDDPREIDVLYANVEEVEAPPGILQQLADGIVDYFNKQGLMKKDEWGRENVKLHVTLLNSKYRNDNDSQDMRAARAKRESFDGSEILEKYRDFDFGVMELSEIHLSQRHSVGPDGYYQPSYKGTRSIVLRGKLVMDEERSSDEDSVGLIQLSQNGYSASLRVPNTGLNTEMDILRCSNGPVIKIEGRSRIDVKTARRQLNEIIKSSRMVRTPNHFISIPINKPDIMENFTPFQEAVLRECQAPGIDESIFIKAGKLHLTMGVMCLVDRVETDLGSNRLTLAKEKVIMPLLQEHLPVKLRIKGLAYMRDDPKNINVLYAKVEEFETTSGVLQLLADSVVSFFHRKGLMMKEEHGKDTVTLHVTLLNTKYRKTSSQGTRSSRSRKRKPFDGRKILETYGDYDFGLMELTEIHLSQCHNTGADGYYQPTCVISIP